MLTLLSYLYRAGWRIKQGLYAIGLRTPRRLDARVICVGNLTTGGTGKTPMVIHLARFFQEQGHRVAVLTRGYKGKRTERVTLVSDGERRRVSAEESGDEAALMADALPGIPVIASPDRYAAGMEALRRFATEVFILDDGYQHLQLSRDRNLLLIDATNPFGGGRLLPAGRLREPLDGIRRADAVILTRTDQAGDLSGVVETLRRYHPEAPIFRSVHEPYALEDPRDGTSREPDDLLGREVIALSGIGNPGAFRDTLNRLGAKVVREWTLPDHHDYTPEDFERLRSLCREHPSAQVVTTEKDRVRVETGSFGDLPMWVLKIRIRIVEEEGWKEWLRANCRLGCDPLH